MTLQVHLKSLNNTVNPLTPVPRESSQSFLPGPRQCHQSISAGDLGQLLCPLKVHLYARYYIIGNIIIYNIHGKNLYMANIINWAFRIDEKSRQTRP